MGILRKYAPRRLNSGLETLVVNWRVINSCMYVPQKKIGQLHHCNKIQHESESCSACSFVHSQEGST